MTEEAVVSEETLTVDGDKPKQKTLADYSVVELESLAYRELVKIEQAQQGIIVPAQNNIRAINAELAKRK